MEELKRRKALQTPPSFLDPSFQAQYKASLDKSLFKAVQCTRRAGKTTGEIGEQLEEAVNLSPGTKHLFMALTLDSAKNIGWDIVINALDKNKVSHRANRNTGEIHFDNGSYFRFFGVDASYQEMKKVLGGKYKTVKIDEAGSMRQNLKTLTYQMIAPALVDLDGRLTLLGTAENIPKTFFEEVTSGKEPGWSVHKWTTIDNPYMKDKWEAHLKWIDENNPNFKLTSEFKTHYLNEWCADDKLLIIRINENTIVDPFEFTAPTYILGADIGYNDATAITLVAYHAKSPKLYVVKSYKEPGLDITGTADLIKSYLRRYPIAKVIIDGANKQGVEEIKNRHNIPLIGAEKTDKASFLKILADDITMQRVHYFKGQCDSLIEEQQSLQWEDSTKQHEDERIPNDQNDSFLYAWRYARNYLWQEQPKADDINSDKFMKDYAKRLADIRRKQNED